METRKYAFTFKTYVIEDTEGVKTREKECLRLYL